MSSHRRSRLIPSVEHIEPRVVPSGGLPGNLQEIMAVFHQVAQQQRAATREVREVAREAEHSAIQAQVDKMREAANFALASGVLSGAMEIGSGATSIGSGAVGIKGASRAGGDHLAHTGRTFEKGQIGSVGESLAGIGQIENSALLAILDAQQAERKELEAEAGWAGVGKEQEELARQMEETMQQILEQLAQIQASQQEAMQSILRA